MPVDHKRINGPEVSAPYELFVRSSSKVKKNQAAEAAVASGTRADSRAAKDHRKIFLKPGVVSQAKGSAYIEVDKTKVIVSVFDPREIPNRNEYTAQGEVYCEFKYATFSCAKRRLHQQDAEERSNSAIMKQALESAVVRHEFPNLQVDIYALVLQNDGSAVSAAINAAGVALAHAGIPMYDLVASATMSIHGGSIYVDPTLQEEKLGWKPVRIPEKPPRTLSPGETGHGTVILSLLNTHEQVSQFYQSGCLPVDTVSTCVTELTKAAKEIVPLIEKCLVRHVVNSVKNKSED